MPSSTRRRPMQGEGVNPETGEVIDIRGHVDLPSSGRKHKTKQRRHRMFALVDGIRVADLELTRQEAKIFWLIAGHLSKDTGLAAMSTAQMVEHTGWHRSNVAAALTSLKQRRIIRRERVGIWQINPWLAFSGTAEDWETATEDAPQPEWSRS